MGMVTWIYAEYTKGRNTVLHNFYSQYFEKNFYTFGEYVDSLNDCKFLGYIDDKLYQELEHLSFCMEETNEKVYFIGEMCDAQIFYKLVFHPRENMFSGDTFDFVSKLTDALKKKYNELQQPDVDYETFMSDNFYSDNSEYRRRFINELGWLD